MDVQGLLRRSVAAYIDAQEHPVIEERDEAAAEVGLTLQQVVQEELEEAVPLYATLDGVKELSVKSDGESRLYVLGAFYLLSGNRDRMLPVEADLNVRPGADSTVSVGGEESVFELPTSERQFVRHMQDVRWAHRLNLRLA